MAGDEDNFCHSLETRALKKSSNNEIFERIKVKFDENLHKSHIQEKIKLQLGNKFERCPKIDTSVPRLRGKYKWLKDQWRKYQDRTRHGTGKAPQKEPDWLIVLDPVFSETHATLELATKGSDINSDSSSEESVIDGVNSSLESPVSLRCQDGDQSSLSTVSTSEFDPLSIENQDTDDDDDDSAKVRKVAPAQLHVTPRRRTAKPKSQAQSLADLSQEALNIYKAMEERTSRMMEEEKARDKAFLEFHDRQSDLNRQHELRMMEMMMQFSRYQQALPSQHLLHGGAPNMAYNTFSENPTGVNPAEVFPCQTQSTSGWQTKITALMLTILPPMGNHMLICNKLWPSPSTKTQTIWMDVFSSIDLFVENFN